MEFRFNFQNAQADESESSSGDPDVTTSIEESLECQEILEETGKETEYPDSCLLTYQVSEDVCIHCLDSGEVEQRLCKDSTVTDSGLVKAASSHSDLIPNVYEGGLKVWECSVDLINYLSAQKSCFAGSRVLELGCGAGMPGILAMLYEAKEVHFQDYNPEVIENYTIPNVRLNRGGNCTCKCRYFSGDWDKFRRYHGVMEGTLRYDVILTAETIYKPENYRKITDIFKQFLCDTGVAYVAAKSNYFGVGGGTNDFIQFIMKQKIFCAEICHSVSEGVPREIIKLKRL